MEILRIRLPFFTGSPAKDVSLKGRHFKYWIKITAHFQAKASDHKLLILSEKKSVIMMDFATLLPEGLHEQLFVSHCRRHYYIIFITPILKIIPPKWTITADFKD